MTTFACRISNALATWQAVAIVIALSVIWYALGLSSNAMGALSGIVGIVMTMLVLMGQRRESEQMREMVRELVYATPGARDEVADGEAGG